MLKAQRNRKGASRQQLRAEQNLRRQEIALTRSVIRAKDDFIEAVVSAYENGERHFDGELIAHRVVIRMLLAAQFDQVIPIFGKATLADIERLARKAADESFFSRLIDKWARQRLGDAALQIAGTSLNDVTDAVTQGITAGDGAAAIASRIRRVTSLSRSRAFTVARTETHMAATFAQSETAVQAEGDFGVRLVKVWLPTLDARTRDRHAVMASHPAIPLSEKFIVGGVPMDRPGDPNGGAANVVACRCSMAHRLALDA